MQNKDAMEDGMPEDIHEAANAVLELLELRKKVGRLEHERLVLLRKLYKRNEALVRISSYYGKIIYGKRDNKEACKAMRVLAKGALRDEE